MASIEQVKAQIRTAQESITNAIKGVHDALAQNDQVLQSVKRATSRTESALAAVQRAGPQIDDANSIALLMTTQTDDLAPGQSHLFLHQATSELERMQGNLRQISAKLVEAETLLNQNSALKAITALSIARTTLDHWNSQM